MYILKQNWPLLVSIFLVALILGGLYLLLGAQTVVAPESSVLENNEILQG